MYTKKESLFHTFDLPNHCTAPPPLLTAQRERSKEWTTETRGGESKAIPYVA
ncbi:hypothetical protein BT69DRAFT_1284266 [Atractiella rhizophila]|nr:hypothetical protein BT69DRAFT_1284486 [Atractiella rhizophila]KAH8920152.1 hypothetical protein BT69DRAFT_1284266 [Atractiella rhizophila]